jgi:hypothetical protein
MAYKVGSDNYPPAPLPSSVSVTKDYSVTAKDYYVGVRGVNPVTITLPTDCPNCFEIVVKSELGAPASDRPITITVKDDVSQHFIDGELTYVISKPYEYARLICRNGNWWTI